MATPTVCSGKGRFKSRDICRKHSTSQAASVAAEAAAAAAAAGCRGGSHIWGLSRSEGKRVCTFRAETYGYQTGCIRPYGTVEDVSRCSRAHLLVVEVAGVGRSFAIRSSMTRGGHACTAASRTAWLLRLHDSSSSTSSTSGRSWRELAH